MTAGRLAPARPAQPVTLDRVELERLFEAHPDAIVIQQDGLILYANRAALTLVGARDAADLLGKNVLDFVDPGSRPYLRRRLEQRHAAAPSAALEEQLLRLDGSTVDVEVLALPLRIDGRPAAQLLVRDISERKRMEREREDLLSALAQREFAQRALGLAEEAAGIGVWEWDMVTGRLLWTSGLEPLHGLEPGTFNGTFEHFVERILPEDRAGTLAAIEAAREGDGEFEAEFRVQSAPTPRWVLGKGRVFRDESGTPIRMVGIGLDVTDRRRREAAEELLAHAGAVLSSSLDYDTMVRNLLTVLVPAIADACIVDLVEPDGSLRRAAADVHHPAGEMLGGRLRERTPHHPPGDPRSAVIASGRPRLLARIDDAALTSLGRSGEADELMRALKPTSTMIVPILDGEEALGCIVLTATDHSREYDRIDLRAAEELGRRLGTATANARAYQQAQRLAADLAKANQAKDEFLGLVSHELRTPLTILKGNASVLRRRGDTLTPEERSQSLLEIERDADQLQEIVENMLVLARVAAASKAEPEPLLLRRTLQKLIAEFQVRAPELEIALATPAELVPVEAHEPYLRQVFTNLLSNAAKYARGTPVTVTLRHEDDWAVLTVRDEGPGMTAEALAQIFDPFYRAEGAPAKARGVGLGLTVCQRLVEEMGGEIGVTSEPGKGTEFWIRLPVSADE